jgi:hypothetical protein
LRRGSKREFPSRRPQQQDWSVKRLRWARPFVGRSSERRSSGRWRWLLMPRPFADWRWRLEASCLNSCRHLLAALRTARRKSCFGQSEIRLPHSGPRWHWRSALSSRADWAFSSCLPERFLLTRPEPPAMNRCRSAVRRRRYCFARSLLPYRYLMTAMKNPLVMNWSAPCFPLRTADYGRGAVTSDPPQASPFDWPHRLRPAA